MTPSKGMTGALGSTPRSRNSRSRRLPRLPSEPEGPAAEREMSDDELVALITSEFAAEEFVAESDDEAKEA